MSRRASKTKSERRITKHVLQLRFLNENLYEHEDDLDIFIRDFEIVKARIYSFFKIENKTKDKIEKSTEVSRQQMAQQDSIQKEELEEVDKKNSPQWLKSAYKKIAKETHPDRIQNLNIPKIEKQDREIMYIRASNAIKDSDACTIVEIGTQLNIDLGISTEKIISYLNERCKQIENEIKAIQEKLEWIWFNSDDSAKIHILTSMCRSIGISPTSDKISELLKKIKASGTYKRNRKTGQRPLKRVAHK